jgi:uncharacterized protein (DUF427 family)
LEMKYFKNSDRQTTCPWKGVAHYYDLSVNGEVNAGAAWFYPTAKPQASHINNCVAFWKGVSIVND